MIFDIMFVLVRGMASLVIWFNKRDLFEGLLSR